MKLLVSDYDGTFYTKKKNGKNVKLNIKKIQEFIDKGNLFMLSSGRSYYSLMEYVWAHKIPVNYVATEDGSHLFDKSGNVLYEEFLDTYLIPAVKEVKEEEFLSNPYLKAIKITNQKRGKYVLGTLSYSPYELFALDDVKVDLDTYFELSQIGYFTKEYSYPYLGTKDSVWMSINPNEIKTMDKHIELAKGDVLVLGLGMGYFPFMIANKEEVKSITIIEKDQNIIDLFNEFIFPQFNHKNKIKIIKDDAFSYLNNIKDDRYHMVFADLWHSAEDGIIPFLRLKELEGKLNIPFMYWIDTSLYSMVRRCIITILIEHLENEHPRYDIAHDEMDKAINYIYKKIQTRNINNESDIKELISDKGIDKILES